MLALRRTVTHPLLLLTSLASYGAGFYVPNQSVEATARGNAWVATADSSAAVHYNPAGLSQLSRPSSEVGVYAIHLGNEATIGGTTFEAKEEWQPIPFLYYAQPLNDRVHIGFGLNSPFGLGTEWDTTTPFAGIATDSLFRYVRASAVASYKVSDTFSVGGGLSLNYGDASLEQFVGFPARFEGDGFSITWIVGLRYQPHEKHSFGAVFRSESDFDLEGSFSTPLGSTPAFLEFATPATAAIGYAYAPTSNLIIEANVEWVGWDNFNSLGNNFNPAGAIPFEWESSFIYEIGFTYQINSQFALSVGYDYNENSQPDTFFNPAVADANRHWFNIGLTNTGEDLSWSLAYQYGFSDRDVNGSVIGTNGNYESNHHAILASIRYDF